MKFFVPKYLTRTENRRYWGNPVNLKFFPKIRIFRSLLTALFAVSGKRSKFAPASGRPSAEIQSDAQMLPGHTLRKPFIEPDKVGFSGAATASYRSSGASFGAGLLAIPLSMKRTAQRRSLRVLMSDETRPPVRRRSADDCVQRSAGAHHSGGFDRVSVIVSAQIHRRSLDCGQFRQDLLFFVCQRFCK